MPGQTSQPFQEKNPRECVRWDLRHWAIRGCRGGHTVCIEHLGTASQRMRRRDLSNPPQSPALRDPSSSVEMTGPSRLRFHAGRSGQINDDAAKLSNSVAADERQFSQPGRSRMQSVLHFGPIHGLNAFLSANLDSPAAMPRVYSRRSCTWATSSRNLSL